MQSQAAPQCASSGAVPAPPLHWGRQPWRRHRVAPAQASGSGTAEFWQGCAGKPGSVAFAAWPGAAAAVPAAAAAPSAAAAALGRNEVAALGASGPEEGCDSSFAAGSTAAAAAAVPPRAGAATDEGRGAAAAAERGFWNLSRLQQQLQSLGLAGVTAYGLFNTLYYTCTFLFFWIWVVKVPTGQGLAATAKSFLGVMAAVWAGSQVTKVPRAAAALMLAPLVDRAMAALQRTLGLRTRRAVFLVFVAGCLGLAAALFGIVVLSWS